MKTIEERAEEYIEPFRASLLSCETDLMKQAYIAGAKEALAGQWRKDDGYPKSGLIIGYYPTNLKSHWIIQDVEVMQRAKYFPKMWLPLPEPPKDETE